MFFTPHDYFGRHPRINEDQKKKQMEFCIIAILITLYFVIDVFLVMLVVQCFKMKHPVSS